MTIDTPSGARASVSSFAIGSGPESLAPNGAAWDSAAGRMLAVDQSINGLVSYNPADGSRALISSYLLDIGTGTAISWADDVVVVNGAVLAGGPGAVVRVDLTTGDRNVVTSNTVGAGPPIVYVRGIAIRDQALSELWIIDNDGTVLRVDPITGDRSVVSDDVTGSGPVPFSPRDLLYDEANGRLIAVTAGVIFAVDPLSGDRVELSGVNVGSGPSIGPGGQATLEGDVLFVGRSDGWSRST